MASPEKKPRMESDSQNSATGFIHSVSPMKVSQKGNNFFNAKLQEFDKVTDIVGYNEKMHGDLKRVEEQRFVSHRISSPFQLFFHNLCTKV